MEEIFRHL